MRLRVKLLVTLTAAALASGVAIVVTNQAAHGHGAMFTPGSRTYLCYVDGLVSTGEIKPYNPACQNALNVGGAQPFYDWFGVLRSDGAGRTRGFIPDGTLCGGGLSKYAGFDAPRNDWPLTHLTAGAQHNFRYSNWAAHPGWFYLYVTKEGFNPNTALTWNDMEEQPFYTADHPPMSGPAPNGYYYWNANLPQGKTGRHVIYSVWQRSDSQETFYGCSDVIFDGGNGEVTGMRPKPGDPTPTPSPSVSSPSPSTSPGGACGASYREESQWNNGFQGTVTVSNPGTATLNGWTVRMTFANGQTVGQVWNGIHNAGAVRNEAWNGSVAGGASTTFGFLGTWSGTNNPPTLTCSSP